MSDKVRLGFIGSGGIVRSHLEQGLKDFPDVEFAAWCDLNEQTAAARKEQVGGKGAIYTDAKKMLDEVKPDAVYIMLPPFAHGPTEQLVIERRIPFFVEKPVAIDLPTAQRTMEGVNKHGLLTAVGYMTRYRHSVQRVRELLKTQKPVLMYGGWIDLGRGQKGGRGDMLLRPKPQGLRDQQCPHRRQEHAGELFPTRLALASHGDERRKASEQGADRQIGATTGMHCQFLFAGAQPRQSFVRSRSHLLDRSFAGKRKAPRIDLGQRAGLCLGVGAFRAPLGRYWLFALVVSVQAIRVLSPEGAWRVYP